MQRKKKVAHKIFVAINVKTDGDEKFDSINYAQFFFTTQNSVSQNT